MGKSRPTGASDATAALLDEIYSAHFTRWTRLAYLIVGRADVAEELVQDSIMRCLPRLSSLDNPFGYLRTTVVNAAKRWWGRQVLEQRSLERVAASENRGPEPGSASDMLRLLSDLPPRQRAIVALRFYEDMSEREVAETLGIPVGTVKSSLHRALHALRSGVTL